MAAIVALAALGAATIVRAQSSFVAGVTYTSKYFELVKKMGVAARASVIHPDEELTDDMRAAADGEALAAMQVLGQPLEAFMTRLAAADGPYPLLRGAILDYRYLRPMDESPEHGRMYIMYVGELYWPFPAPLLADMIRVRVTWDTPHTARDLLTAILVRWGRDNVEQPPADAKEMPHLKVQALLDDLKDPELAHTTWRMDQTVRELLRRKLTPPQVAALEAMAREASTPARLAALKILGVGGLVSDAKFYAGMLNDATPAVPQAAFWALLQLGDKAALKAVKDFPGRTSAIAARLNETHATVSGEELKFEVATLDWLIATALGGKGPRPQAAAPPPKPVPEPRAPDGYEGEPAAPGAGAGPAPSP
jgi:hypothetical protein